MEERFFENTTEKTSNNERLLHATLGCCFCLYHVGDEMQLQKLSDVKQTC